MRGCCLGSAWHTEAEIGQDNVLRFSNKGDLVSVFDNSALKTSHADPQNYAPSFWHDFRNKEQAGGRIAGVSVPEVVSTPGVVDRRDNTVKTTWDAHPFNRFNLNPNYLTYDKTEGDKMTE